MTIGELRRFIIATIEALTPLEQTDSSDRYYYDPDESEEEARPNRAFLLETGQLADTANFLSTTARLTFSIILHYTADPDIADRSMQDARQVQLALWSIQGGHNGAHPDLTGVVDVDDAIPREVYGQSLVSIDFGVEADFS